MRAVGSSVRIVKRITRSYVPDGGVASAVRAYESVVSERSQKAMAGRIMRAAYSKRRAYAIKMSFFLSEKSYTPAMPHAPIQSVHVNRKALWDYESLTSYEAGIILTGSEVKALRDGSVNLRSAWIALASGRPQIIGMHIGRYQHSSEVARDDGKRPRDILMKKKDIAYLG